ncbi:MAG: hypothetical protein NC241_07075 [Bacteroides sp.]|nr:hypothetical protein [Bacteroides sp.]MCM1456626.1 hypothetical protein [Lachnoclostridium sp.]
MKHLSNHILKLILAVSALIVCANLYADEVTKIQKKEPCGFEWIKVNYQGKVGAQTASGDWIVPLRNNQTILFSNFEKGGNAYGYFHVVKNLYDSDFSCALVSPFGKELLPNGKYADFFWSKEDNCMLGIIPDDGSRYPIDVDLSELLLSSPQPKLNQLLIGTWRKPSGLFTTETLSFSENSDFMFEIYDMTENIYVSLFSTDNCITGSWILSGSTVIFKTKENKIDEKYSVKVLSPTEIELIPIESSELFRGRYNK